MNHAQFRRVFEQAGLTKSELAYIYQVSRQTLYNWYRDGVAPTQGGLAERADNYTTALVRAVEARVLPMPPNLDRPVRKKRLLDIATQLHKLATPKEPK